ncbi:MAG: VIT domain-containing protein [Burkholderiales bacterium]
MPLLHRSRAICHAVHRLVSLITLAAASFAAFAQVQVGPAVPPPVDALIARPQLIVRNGADQAIQLRAVRIDTEITGTIAHTTTELLFYNPNRRVLEGELQFPLADGQTITAFAMDVDGKMRDAVPVDKPRAQAVFEDITRQNIDPGLLQVTQGNNFKLRVYPLNALQEKRVRIRTIESLAQRDHQRLLRLPLEFGAPIDTLSLAVHTVGEVAPKVIRGAIDGMRFEQSGNGHRATIERRNFKAGQPLEIALDAPSRPAVIVGQHGGKSYFYAEVPLKTLRTARSAPRVLGIVWDSSGSAASRDRGREIAFLDAFFQRARDLEVRLIRLRDRAEPAESFRITQGNWQKLRTALEATPYDGATNFGAFAADPSIDEYLLVTDGLTNFGDTTFPATRGPVHTILSAVKADPVVLRFIAERSGGRFVDLARTASSDASAAILSNEERIDDVASTGATDLVFASRFAQQGFLTVTGVLRETSTAIKVQLTGGKSPRTIEFSIDGASRDSTVAPWLWARTRITQLEGEATLNRGEVRRLGRHFGIPTRETSLIILDRVADYVRYEIDPPAELRDEYERLRATSAGTATTQKRGQINRVVAMLREKEAWWHREFPKEARPSAQIAPKVGNVAPRRADEAVEHRRQITEDMRDMMSARPSAAPAPSAPPATESSVASVNRIEAGAAQRKSKDATGHESGVIAIQLKAWSPDAPYARRLRETRTEDLYRVYLDERPSFAASTAFFLDAADLFFSKGLSELGARVLSNLAEMDLENRHILRILGYRLMQANEAKLAIAVFKKVQALAPDEPQSYRDLGLAFAADRQFQPAIDALYEVIERPWHGRFPEIELIALAELNAIRATAGTVLDTSRMDARLLKNLPLDLRVVLSWDADNTDIDLWVTDPNGEKCFYSNRLTHQGGRMSADFTGGYGPEEFSLKIAKPGKYKVEAQFYGHRQQIVAGATTLSLRLSTKFGTAAQIDKAVTLRLTGQREIVQIGEFEVK